MRSQARLREALLALSTSESTFTSAAPELPALAVDGHTLQEPEATLIETELAVLRGAAKEALAMDDNLRLMRFQLVSCTLGGDTAIARPRYSVSLTAARAPCRRYPLGSRRRPSGTTTSCA